MLMKEIMESELNKKIRELLELFEINPDIVVGEWNLIGHLKQFIESLLSKQRASVVEKVEAITISSRSTQDMKDEVLSILKEKE